MADRVLTAEEMRVLRLRAEGSTEGWRIYAGALAASHEALRARLARLKGAVRTVEWAGPMYEAPNGNPIRTCPSCWRDEAIGHALDCALARALAGDGADTTDITNKENK